jgi:hypothetical protein
MIENVDYVFVFPEGNATETHIKLVEGPYKDTTIKYGRVKFKEESDGVHLLFAYDVIESTLDAKKLVKDEKFKNYLGDLLVEIMSGNTDEEFIDETGTDDIKKSDLQ